MSITFKGIHYIKTQSVNDANKVKEAVEDFAISKGLKDIEGFVSTTEKDVTIVSPFKDNIDRYIFLQASRLLRIQNEKNAAEALERFTDQLMKTIGYKPDMIKPADEKALDLVV